MKASPDKLPGIALTVILALPAWFLGRMFPIIGSPVLGILFGMMLAFWKRPVWLERGITYTARKLLQYSIILLGFDMNLFNVLTAGKQTIFLMLFTLSATFFTAFIAGKLLKLSSHTTILIGVGTAICGGSAIAATAPLIHAKDEDVARSISTIFLFNIIAAFLFPFLGHILHMTDYHFGLWTGTAVNDTSSVIAAGYAFSTAAGNLAIIVKLTRTLTIVPIIFVLAILTARKTAQHPETRYPLSKVFPWFILGFIAASFMSTFFPIPNGAITLFTNIGKFAVVMAMVAMGLNTPIALLIKNGRKPLLLGFSCWAVLSTVSLLIQYRILKI